MYFLIIFLCGLHGIQSQQNFTGHKLIGAFPSSEEEIDALRGFMNNTEIDFWNQPIAKYEKVNIRLPPEVADEVEEGLRDNGIDYYVISDNLQDWVERELRQNPKPSDPRSPEDFRVDLYHRYEEIMSYLDSLRNHKADSLSIEVTNIGTSSQGNSIKAIKIGSGGNNKPVIWIDSGIHSREWVSPATALFIVDYLWRRSGEGRIKKLLNTFDWYIVPLVNPDGYIHTWSTDRMWRKNRVVSGSNYGRQCYGVDLNRNFDSNFGGKGTSQNPCSDLYAGKSAFSEPESRAIRDAATSMRNRLKAFITIHSYSQLWMCPYGYTYTFPKDYQDMMAALRKAASAIVQKHGEWYRYGTIANTIYPASGSSVDWAYDALNVKYSFALELRDRGQYGFMLPRQYIIPTAEETFEGILAVADHISAEL